jgi:soluble lytic murein transglycosylase-like protein
MQLVINTNHRHKRLIGVAALLLGITLLLLTNGRSVPDNIPGHASPPTTLAKVYEATAVEIPREIIVITEDIVSRFKVKKGTALSITTEAFTAARNEGIQPALVLAIVAVESHYKPNAINRYSGAKGLMQVLPRFHKEKVAEAGGEQSMLQIGPNIRVGSAILAEYLDTDSGNLHHALGRYYGSPAVDVYFNLVRTQMRHFEQVLKSIEAT